VPSSARGGRARWKIENESFNTLETKGYNLEHHSGHDKDHLCAVLVVFPDWDNLIATLAFTRAPP